MKPPTGFQALPFITTEVVDADPRDLASIGLGDIDGLAGWKVFKKIGHAFKKVGKAISKIKISKIVKIAIPIVGGLVLGPLLGLPLAKITEKFGSKAASLISKGATQVQRVVRTDGKEAAALLTPDQYKKLQAITKDPKQAITEAALKRIFGPSAIDFLVPGAEVKNGMLELPVTAPPKVEQSTIDARAAGIGTGAIVLAVGIALAMGGRRARN
jgi:uncharacterized protein YacL